MLIIDQHHLSMIIVCYLIYIYIHVYQCRTCGTDLSDFPLQCIYNDHHHLPMRILAQDAHGICLSSRHFTAKDVIECIIVSDLFFTLLSTRLHLPSTSKVKKQWCRKGADRHEPQIFFDPTFDWLLLLNHVFGELAQPSLIPSGPRCLLLSCEYIHRTGLPGYRAPR